jgi:6-pyruvoyltetrahydropterin/6-carboxytetrahydropterin synthase
MPNFHVRVSSDDLVFSAAHFITLAPNRCEPLHGHNYRVAAEVHGPLGESHYVVDFLVLHDALRAIVAELDHRVLLPTEHATIHLLTDPDEVEVAFADHRWVFPRSDCVLLPIANTTAELLARHIAEKLLERLESAGASRPAIVRIAVAERGGLQADCELTG